VRIRCRLVRRHRAVRVARVPLRYVPGKVGQANINPLFFQLLMASHRTRFRTRRQNDLDRRRREHHGAHVAPVGYEAGWRREVALALQQLQAHPAIFSPFKILRELWLDRALIVIGLLYLTFQVLLVVNAIVPVPICESWSWTIFSSG